jgi:hypothetical protein
MQDRYNYFVKRTFVLLITFMSLWIIYVAIGLWKYASIETEPPVFDSLSYVQKAQTFWSYVNNGKVFNPLSIEPTIRPFGTVFMSYPFGYVEDFRGFYFRSMFIPIVIFALSVICLVTEIKLSSKHLIILFSIAVALTSAPCNYQLQIKEGIHSFLGTWGYVDTFFSSVLGLATAFAINKDKNRLIRNAIICSTIVAFSIFIKPAGLMMMGVLAIVWLIVQSPPNPKQWVTVREYKISALIFLGVYGVTIVSVVGSKYFAQEHAIYGLRGMEMLREMQPNLPAFSNVMQKFHISIGTALTSLLCLGIIFCFRKGSRRYFFATLFVLICGIWLWLIKTNIEHVRYFLPFQVIALIIVIPTIINVIGAMPLKINVIFTMLLLTPTFLIGYLISVKVPSQKLQTIVGINLSANIHETEVRQAQELRDYLIEDGRATNIIYYAGTSPKIRAFESVMDYDRLVGGSRAKSIPALPIDWVREHSFRLDEIIRAQFIIFEPIENPSKVFIENKIVDSFEREESIIRAWLTNLGVSDGISVFSQASLCILQVGNQNDLYKAASTIYKKYSWRESFLKGFTKRWVTQAEINSLQSNLIRNPVDLYLESELIASIVGAELSCDKDENILAIYIRQFHSLPSDKDTTPWFVFVHLLQTDGKIVDIYHEPFLYMPTTSDAIGVYKISFSSKKSSNTVRLAIGVFSPKLNGHVHMLNKNGDWDGRRTVIKYPEVCSSGKK